MSTSCVWEGKGRIWLIPFPDETQGVQVKLCYSLTTRAIPGPLRHDSCASAIDYLYLFTFIFTFVMIQSNVVMYLLVVLSFFHLLSLD